MSRPSLNYNIGDQSPLLLLAAESCRPSEPSYWLTVLHPAPAPAPARRASTSSNPNGLGHGEARSAGSLNLHCFVTIQSLARPLSCALGTCSSLHNHRPQEALLLATLWQRLVIHDSTDCSPRRHLWLGSSRCPLSDAVRMFFFTFCFSKLPLRHTLDFDIS